MFIIKLKILKQGVLDVIPLREGEKDNISNTDDSNGFIPSILKLICTPHIPNAYKSLNKRPMVHTAHPRNQLKSINSV